MIRNKVTRGFGNGVFLGTIPLRVRQGFGFDAIIEFQLDFILAANDIQRCVRFEDVIKCFDVGANAGEMAATAPEYCFDTGFNLAALIANDLPVDFEIGLNAGEIAANDIDKCLDMPLVDAVLVDKPVDVDELAAEDIPILLDMIN